MQSRHRFYAGDLARGRCGIWWEKKKILDCSEVRFEDVPFVTQTRMTQPLVASSAELSTEEADTSETCLPVCMGQDSGSYVSEKPGLRSSHSPAGTGSFSSKH